MSCLTSCLTGQNLLPCLLPWEARLWLPAAGRSPPPPGGGGGRRALLRALLTLEKRSAPRATAPLWLPTAAFSCRSRRCSQSPTTNAPAPRHALAEKYLLIAVTHRACRGVPSPAIHAVHVPARRTLTDQPATFAHRGGGRFVHGHGRSLGVGGRAYAPTPPLRCAIPPTPWRSAARNPAAGGILVFR